MKSLILYHSRTGTTRKLGEEIAKFLKKNDVESIVTSIDEFNREDLDNVNFVLLGCWTSGLMIIRQHPEEEWVDFVKQLSPELGDKKIGLFTTYKIATGSMFKKMKKSIPNSNGNISLLLKSRKGSLSINDQLNLLDFIKDRPIRSS